MEIVIEIAGVSPGPKYLVKSYPLLDQDTHGGVQYYEVPLYSIYIWKAKNHNVPSTYSDRQDFRAVRFGIYHNDGSISEYKAQGLFVVGLLMNPLIFLGLEKARI
jgi:hypothetical protein